jgi:hypothetical protein
MFDDLSEFGLAFCGTLRHPAGVTNLRTANYSEHDRQRLGEAVAAARRAAGHRWRTSFAEEAKVGIRSVEAVERAEPTVGIDVLERIGRALGRHFRDWSADSARTILEGGPIPGEEPRRRTTIDIRAGARRELVELLTSNEDAIAYPRLLNRLWDRFAAAGYDERDLLEVSKQAEEEAARR